MSIKKFLILGCLFLFPKFYSGHEIASKIYIVLDSTMAMEGNFSPVIFSEQELLNYTLEKRPTPLLQLFHSKHKKNKKLTAAILSFPLPFGIVGLHRIYLGSAPYVPVVYIASLGGALGLLPLIDFCFILLDKNSKTFENNKKVFMWVN